MAKQAASGSTAGDEAKSGRPGQPESEADAAEIARLAAEVLRYLQRHPGAADTVEGIAEWWIAKQRLEDNLMRVQAAVDRLVAQDLVEPTGGGAGRPRYRLRQAPSADSEPRAGAGASGRSERTGAGD